MKQKEQAPLTDEEKLLLAYGQLEERIQRIPPNVVYLLVAGLAFVYAQRDYHPQRLLEAWLAILILHLIYRMVVWWLFRWHGRIEHLHRWDLLSFSGSALNVLIWAATVPLFCREDMPATVSTTGLFLIAISSGGILTVKTDRRLVLGYSAFLLGSYDFWLWTHLEAGYAPLAGMLLIYLAFVTLAGIRLNRQHLDAMENQAKLEKSLADGKQQETYLKTLLNRVPVGIMKFDPHYRITDCNPAYARLFRVTEQELIGMNILQIRDTRPLRVFKEALAGKEGVYEGEYMPTTGPVERMFIRIRIVPFVDDNGQVKEALCTVEDFTEAWQKEQQIRNMAFYDELTGMPNRKLLSERLAQLISLYRRRPQPGALFYLDLDNFKDINDQHGHWLGDRVLVEAVRRIRSVLREEDTLARMGGDEFVILLPGISRDANTLLQQVETISNRIHQALREPMEIEGRLLHTDASIGVVSLEPDVNEEELLRRADLAMYRAKEQGRGRTQFYDQKLDEQARERRSLQQDLRTALEHNELELYYQPILDMQGRIVAAEGLLRWHHPQRGMVPPDRFISIAEELGIIEELGHWVLETGCAQLAMWQGNPAINLQYLSLNASPRELASDAYVQHLASLLARHRLSSGMLKLEITESVLLRPESEEVQRLKQITELGVELFMDDFGTGYASLEYMSRYPFSGMKIDRVFVNRLLDDLNSHMLVAAMLAIAEQFGYRVVLEGVETADILHVLRRMAPHSYFQGYLCSPPLPLEEFEQLVGRGHFVIPDEPMEYQ